MCGIIGIYNHPEAANLAYLGLYALQHRGQESAGIVSSNGERLFSRQGMGHVADIFTEEVLKALPGSGAVGHTRYSTAGESTLINCQPILIQYHHGWLASAHNGNLVNIQKIRKDLESEGSIFQSTMDTEVVVHLIAHSRKNSTVDRIIDALLQIKGAYSMVFLTETRMVAARDPFGWRPLVIGQKKPVQEGGQPTWVVASETCALDLLEADFVREVEPGEIVLFDSDGVQSFRPFPIPRKKAMCIFEFIYFSRPDSHIFGRDVYEMRKGFGKQLAREHAVDADVVIPIPDSGVPAALGYAEESGISFQFGLMRNHYVGRTFIEPQESIRHFGVKIKLNPVRDVLKGKRVIVVDDSIVRGTTSRKIVKMIRDAGAKEVHMRISSPPITDPCFYGIDTPTKEELIASSHGVDEIRKFIGADSLGYLSTEGLYWFEKNHGEWFCDACFTGDYPVAVEDASAKLKLTTSLKSQLK
ncbi:MAG: amidophosphoribosyltransferase [Deltaproteobacteria bacterium]|nr:amidophosphoribosyltransferase [Deltaproteobacteria bacterium]